LVDKIMGKDKKRGILGMVLLSLLAVCGYMGTQNEVTQTVSVSGSRARYETDMLEMESLESARKRLNRERETELEILQSVAESENSDDALRRNALEQLTVIAGRMELEGRLMACLEEMGYDQALPVLGAQGMTVICPSGSLNKEEERLRVINAVCGVSGYEARDIKIILTKK